MPVGKLYVVATPIGNLEDITIRALKTLRGVDFILAESPKTANKLLQKYKIKKTLIPFNNFTSEKQLQKVISLLGEGKNIAIISNAGTPCISDPGGMLVRKAMENNIPVSPIPGVSAVTTALSVSGLDIHSFIFGGFLPKAKQARQKELANLIFSNKPIILFESPHRLIQTLNDVLEIYGDNDIIIVREATKYFEEIIHKKVSEIIEYFTNQKILGEFCIILPPKIYSENDGNENNELLSSLFTQLNLSQQRPKQIKAIIKILSALLKIPKNKIHKLFLQSKQRTMLEAN